jgi:hypothetical protein
MVTRLRQITAVKRRGVAVALTAAFAGISFTGYFIASAVAAPAVSVPVITGHPANPSTSTTAVFSYIDSQGDDAFKCSLDGAVFSSCPPGSMTYKKLRLGDHTFAVEAGSGFSYSAPARFSWRIEPPAPVFLSHPGNPSEETSPEFVFADADWPKVRFFCHLDTAPVMNCTGNTDHDFDQFVPGEWQFRHVTPGRHCFYVYAVGSVIGVGGVASPVTRFCWTVSGPILNFSVGGDLTEPLSPGTSESLNMTFTNPNSVPIHIAKGAITAANIAITTNKPGCAGSNFAVTQGLTIRITIPAGQSSRISLAELGVPQGDWPVIAMLETGKNQDACQNATLTLTYSGIVATG